MLDRFVVTGTFTDDPFAIDIAQYIGLRDDISDTVALKTFANSEFCPRYMLDVYDEENIGKRLRGKIVLLCSVSTHDRSRNDLAMRTCILARAAKDNGADRVVLVEPDLFYSAQDRGPHRFGENEKDRDISDLKKFDGQPFTSLLYAQLLKASGVDAVVTVHNHSVKVQQLFSEIFEGHFHNMIPTEVYANYIKTSNFVQTGKDGDNLVIVAPDKGATPFVNAMWDALELSECKRVIMTKVRSGEREVSMTLSDQSEVDFDYLAGKDVIVFDDMVRTGSTIVQCCEHLKKGNPHRVCFGVTHFHSSPEAREKLNSHSIDEILTTSTLPDVMNRDCQGRLRRKLTVLKLAKWMARYVMQVYGEYDGRFDKNFYKVDMSSKNPRWPPPHLY
ncbi:MAG: ribose-phosphate pyrophosphokinase [Fibrobacteres bacterium CG2_30_45_31]|jgi:ribose-phosphate pyrophosphokinase|nr:MAG: ribose-phosphate pyrophosphokinase [Fibrobacteres bacterium CG2_30_45_31]